MLLLPAVQSHIRFIRPQNPMNNSNALSSLPKSFPIPIEGRDDFFSVDPRSLSIEQLNKYKTEIDQYIEGIKEEITYEKKLTDEFEKELTSRIQAYQSGIQCANYGEITPNHKYLNRYFLFCIFRIKHTKTKITCSID
ncbi:unnamed protein product [Rotaria magnacalcarata]